MAGHRLQPIDNSLLQVLNLPLDDAGERGGLRALARKGGIAFGIVLALMLAWSFTAPLSGAIIASGTVKTELNRKTVQHQEGGIVRAIRVREGQRVKAGDVLVVVGDVRSDATLDLQQDQRLAELVRQARLNAELKLAAEFSLPPGMASTAAAAEYLDRERSLFDARRRTLVEQVDSLQLQVRETESQVRALALQIESIEAGARSAGEELEIHRRLVEQGFIQRTRILALERAVMDYDSRAGEQKSEQALARQRLADLRSRVVQARNQYLQQAASDLKDTVARLREIDERLRPAQDQFERQYVRSPVDGEVMGIRVASVGAVVAPREPILDVVPAQERLVVEARIAPQDIEFVRGGVRAEVRLSAFDSRVLPLLGATVTSVSGDRIEDPRSGAAWFSVLLDVDASGLEAFPGVRMQAGMPAEVYVTTPARTLFEYLARPLVLFGRRGMREP
jgi:HlyD family type I secretion membrane fusion protein